MSLIVNEIFVSIQGESSFAGLPCTFIRLTGCNLRCSYCDTAYAYEDGERLSIAETYARAGSPSAGLVEVTGGEPLLQPETTRLVEKLLKEENTVLVETNGSMDIRRLPAGAIAIVDMKCPSSGMSDRMDLENLRRLRPEDELKFVIRDAKDYGWAKSLLKLLPSPTPEKLLFSPAWPDLAPRLLAEWILADHLPVRLQIPLQRILWPHEFRGR